MESLEETLKKVEDLRRDLSAEIVVQEERGEWYSVDKDMIDERIAEPDIVKRANATRELQKIYDSSEWYSTRYSAGIALCIDNSQLNIKMGDWIAELGEALTTTKKEERKIESIIYEESYDPRGYYHGSSSVATKVEGTGTFNIINRERIFNTIKDAGQLLKISNSSVVKDFLIKIYNGNYILLHNLGRWFDGVEEVDDYGRSIETGFFPKMRKSAGKALGYSPLRIWVHEDPIVAIMTGIAVAAASGLAYYIIKFK